MALDVEQHAALMAHDAAFLVDEASVDGVAVMATVDALANPSVVTVLGVREDGTVLHARRTVPSVPGEDLGVRDVVQRAMAVGRPLPLTLSQAFEWFGCRGGEAGFARHYADSFQIRNEELEVPREVVAQAANIHLMVAGAPETAERLDAGALESLSCISRFGSSAYDFYAAPGARGEARRQAAAAYPLLAADMAARPLVKFAIDMKKPLVEPLERAYGADEAGNPFMSKALLRRLQGARLPDHGIPSEVLVQTLGRIPADWFPRDADDWKAFCDLTDVGFRDFAREMRERPDKLCPNAAGKWAEVRTRVAKAAASTLPPEDLNPEARKAWRPEGDESREGLSSSFANAQDVIHMFRDLVVLPVAVSEVQDDSFIGPEGRQLAFEAAARILFGGKSLVAIMEAQRLWHSQAANVLAATETPALPRPVLREVAEDGWAPLCDVVTAPNGVVIVPLTDPRELQDEGSGGPGNPGPDRNGIMGLGHCVGGYSAQCKKGTSHIVSFRVPTQDGFRRLSTAEFNQLSADSDILSCRQHHGVRNGSPPKEAKEAFDWFVGEVASQRIPLNRDGIRMVLEGKPPITDDVQRACGYDRKDLDLVAKVLAAWKPHLPKRFRDMDVDALRECAEMEELVESAAPRFRTARFA